MLEIAVMPDSLVSQVAAGEVVERPASVVKELIENSLDAEAGQIEVYVQRGGISMIRVLDDGKGMAREDALLSIERHATSKLRTKEDLADIGTFGFRGEALPSIASVSRFQLTTRRHDALNGTEINIEGGKLQDVRDSGAAPGTQIEVRSLFFNLPARRKFLRAESTELSHVEHQVRVHAAVHPAVGFSFRHGDRLALQLPKGQDLAGRLANLASPEIFEKLVRVAPSENHGISIEGWASPPGFGRGSKNLQYVFINGRPVDAAAVNIAAREVYRRLLPQGQHPVLFLYLTMDRSEVDVNVHPAKREVRFVRERLVREAIAMALKGALDAHARASRPPVKDYDVAPAPEIDNKPPAVSPAKPIRSGRTEPIESATFDRAAAAASAVARSSLTPDADSPKLPLEDPEPPAEEEQGAPAQEAGPGSAHRFRVVGTIEGGYVLLESGEGLVLMHHQAAHERVLFEQARREVARDGEASSQQLLFPCTMELDPIDFDLVVRHLGELKKLGLGAEIFGKSTLKIESMPAIHGGSDAEALVQELIRELHEGGRRVGDDLILAAVCRNAVKSRAEMKPEEIESLVGSLLDCEMPYCDPSGRPTLIQFSRQELERKFGRTLG